MPVPEGNVLVTGGCGFVGRHLIPRLVKDYENVIIVDDLSNSEQELHDAHRCLARRESKGGTHPVLYIEDVRNERTISEIIKRHKIRHCIHLAAQISVTDSIQKPYDTFSVNVGGTISVLQACLLNQVDSFIFASSAAVYGPVDKLPISESSPINPISPYGASKVAGESLVSVYSSHIKNSFCLRFFNIYGCHQRSAYAGVISKYTEQLRKRLPLEIYGNGAQTRDFVHIDDVVEAILLALDYRESHPVYIMNIGTGQAVSINLLAKCMKKLYGSELPDTIFEEPEEGSILHSFPDISSATRILNYIPEVTLEKGLERMIVNSKSELL